MGLYFSEKNSIKRDEIAARQLYALKQHYSGKLRLTDVIYMFRQMSDQVTGGSSMRAVSRRNVLTEILPGSVIAFIGSTALIWSSLLRIAEATQMAQATTVRPHRHMRSRNRRWGCWWQRRIAGGIGGIASAAGTSRRESNVRADEGSGLMDAFDRIWQWANKPLDDHSTIPAELHHAVTSLREEDWHDREKVNAAAAVRGYA
jgi:hypothetical protein